MGAMVSGERPSSFLASRCIPEYTQAGLQARQEMPKGMGMHSSLHDGTSSAGASGVTSATSASAAQAEAVLFSLGVQTRQLPYTMSICFTHVVSFRHEHTAAGGGREAAAGASAVGPAKFALHAAVGDLRAPVPGAPGVGAAAGRDAQPPQRLHQRKQPRRRVVAHDLQVSFLLRD